MVVTFLFHTEKQKGELFVAQRKGAKCSEAKQLLTHGCPEDVVCYSPTADFIVVIRLEEAASDVSQEFFDSAALVFADKMEDMAPSHYLATPWNNIKQPVQVVKNAVSLPELIDENLVESYPIGPRSEEPGEEYAERLNEFIGLGVEQRKNFAQEKLIHQEIVKLRDSARQQREKAAKKREDATKKFDQLVIATQNKVLIGPLVQLIAASEEKLEGRIEVIEADVADVRVEVTSIQNNLRKEATTLRQELAVKAGQITNRLDTHFGSAEKQLEIVVHNLLIKLGDFKWVHCGLTPTLTGGGGVVRQQEVDLLALEPTPTLVEVTLRIQNGNKVAKMLTKCLACENTYRAELGPQNRISQMILVALAVDPGMMEEVNAEIEKIKQTGRRFELITGDEIVAGSKKHLSTLLDVLAPPRNST